MHDPDGEYGDASKAMRVEQTAEYQGNDLWEWSVSLAGTSEELSQISHVEYTLDSSFRPPVRTSDKRQSNFRLTAVASDPFTIYLKAVHKDKKSPDTLLEHELELRYPDGRLKRRNSAGISERTFANGNKARFLTVARDYHNADVLRLLGVAQPKTLIMLAGGGDHLEKQLVPRLQQVFRGIALAAIEASALIIDGGTKSGVMEIMGQVVADQGHKSPLLGITPAAKVNDSGQSSELARSDKAELDPNHTHFLLVDCDEWGCEVDTRYALAEELVRNGTSVVTIVVNGGKVTAQEVVRSVRQGYPVIVIEETGGVADQILEAWKTKSDLAEDPLLAEIVADGKIRVHPQNGSVKGLQRLIVRELGTDQVLQQAWERFADYDLNAILQQSSFDRIQGLILVVGVLATLLALSKQVFAPRDENGFSITQWSFWWFVQYLLIAVPIVLTVLITAANRFKQGNKWLLMRAGAESIKREIYQYRARAGDYSEKVNLPAAPTANSTPTSPGSPRTHQLPTAEQVLAEKVEEITRRLMSTEVNTASLKPYDKSKGFPPYMYAADGGDDGFSLLNPDRYVDVRLEDQLRYYKKKALILERKLKFSQYVIFVVGGAGTFLAAINQQVWIALTTAIAAAIATHLSYRQTENTLTKYNQAATDLANCKAWWIALPAEEQARQENLNLLVEHTEKVLQSELDGWVQQMQNALAELRKDQGTAADKAAAERGTAARKTVADKSAAPGPGSDQAAVAGGRLISPQPVTLSDEVNREKSSSTGS